ncbi:acetyl-CoA synthetase-like protein [Aspergillus ellipticus CBS 707.79]|uniref:Acetyl-CoA synthetase-like protein n=1 Tax=Aspergillus ellipticus CBS 707.79 TaxID=1448320 RepID=A0A319DKG4_9EURO|nr:acetyl-CoA synthetase-like protein [Aspergillus ellipticus CBS 707.79]
MAQAAKQEQARDVPTILPFSLLRRGGAKGQRYSIADMMPCTPLQEGPLALTVKQTGEYVCQMVSELPANVDLARFRAAWARVIHEAAICELGLWTCQTPGSCSLCLQTNQNGPRAATWINSWSQRKQLPWEWGRPWFGLAWCQIMRKSNSFSAGPFITHCMMAGRCYRFWNELKPSMQGLAAISSSFAGFVEYLGDCTVVDTQTYWQSQMNGIQAAIFLALPSPDYRPQCRDLLRYHVTNVSWPGNDITPSTAVRTAWAILTSRYTQSPDITFGATVSGRQAPVLDIEGMAGPIIATVPIRVDVQGATTVASLMQSVQTQAVAMIPYEQTGLNQIRRISSDTTQAVQFQSLLVVQPPRPKTSRLPESRLFRLDLDAGDEFRSINTYALMLECHLESDGMRLRVSYDRQVIEVEQVERITRQFEAVLRQVCREGNAQELVRNITAASEHDLAQVWAWNATVPRTIEGYVHDLIAQRTQQQPDAPAIRAWDGQLSYQELDALSSRLAFSLVQQGAGLNSVIPLCFEKTMWMPVAMLAAIKAGSTVVAMDPSQLEDRLQLIVKQTQSRLTLTSETYQPLASRLAEVAICVNGTTLPPQSQEGFDPAGLPAVHPTDGLYIAFTSGSTGSPKGAIMTHQNICSSIEHTLGALGFTSTARVLGFSSYAFDADAVPSLKTLVVGGEAVTSEDLARWAGGVDLKNAYGPAECSAVTAVYSFRDQNDQPSIIGHPTGLLAWVVEPEYGGSLSPPGAIGELWVEGPLGTHGHSGRQGRLYKTGDLVRYTSDGKLIYVARKDMQVKIRGQRVELAEIEHYIKEATRASVVVDKVRPQGSRGPVLVAYVALGQAATMGAETARAALRCGIQGVEDHLSKHLPRYMVPSFYIPILDIPLSAMGKTDRRRLRDMGSSFALDQLAELQPLGNQKRALPQSQTEFKTIARLARREIQTDGLTIDDRELLDTPFALSPIQQFFFDVQQDKHGHFNQSFLVRITRRQQPQAVLRAIQSIVARHSMLRARFRQGPDGGWMQQITSRVDQSYTCRHHRVASLDDAIPALNSSQQSLDVHAGPLCAVGLVDTPPDRQYLFLTAHHLVVDLVSWRILLEELESFLVTGTVPSSSAPLSFQTWCQLQERHAWDHLTPDSAFPFDIEPPGEAYWGLSPERNRHGDIQETGFTLSKATTDILLGPTNHAFQTQPVELFLAALFRSFMNIFTDRNPPIVFSEAHGRQPWSPAIDLSRTVGWFTTLAPIQAAAGSHRLSIPMFVRCIKDRRRQMPHNGWSYFTSRFLNASGRELFGGHGCPEITFNYFGLYQQLERDGALFQSCPSLEDQVADVADHMARFALIDVSAEVTQGCLQFRFLSSKHMPKQGALAQWVAAYGSALEQVVVELMDTQPSYTVSDFPLLPSTDATWRQLQTLTRLGCAYGTVEDIYPCSPVQQGILLSQAKSPVMYWTRVSWRVQPQGGGGVLSGRCGPTGVSLADDSALSDGYSYQIVLKDASPSIHTIQAADPVDAVVRYREASELQARPVHSLLLCSIPSGALACDLQINHAIIDAVSIRSLSPTEAKAYWQTQLAGAQPCIFPNLNEPIADPENGATAVVSLPIRLETDTALRQFRKTHSLTPANVFGLAWALVLCSYTGSKSVCYGTVISGRDVPMHRVDRAVGPFINVLISRVEIDSNQTLLSIMQDMQSGYLRGLKHNHYPLAEILHALSTEGRPFFNTILSVQSGSTAPAQPHTASITFEEETWHDPNEYDIAASVLLLDGHPRISINYSRHLLSARQAHAVAATFLEVLASIVRNPGRHVGDLNTMISPHDLATIWGWNAEVPAAMANSVPELIARRVQQQPDASAVCAWDLGWRVHLSPTGRGFVAAGPPPNGAGLPPAVDLAPVLREVAAGCAAVTIDPEQPAERLQLVMQKTQGLVLTSPAVQALACRLRPEVVVLDGPSLQAMPPPDPLALPIIHPTDRLFVVFSSGTTGTPKGSVMVHQNACSAIHHQQARIGLPPAARMLDSLSYAFDAPWLNFLHAFTSGSCLCIPSDRRRKEDLAGCIRDLRANYALFTPSIARIIDPATVPGLETIALGGEAIRAEDIARWPDVQLLGINTTDEPRMLGHSFGLTAWVVDPLQGTGLVPLGATGELCVEGPLVGQGYVDEPEQTATSFIEDPGWLLRGGAGCAGRRGRVYKTGDLVRSRPDGSLLYVGRKDTQVKIRGQRVELEEIEHHLRQALAAGGADVPVVVDLVWLRGSASPVLLAFLALAPTFAGYIRHGSSITRTSHLSAADDCSRPSQGFVPLVQRKTTMPAPPDRPGFTPATVFTTLCAHMLARLTGLTDLVFATSVSGRTSLPIGLRSVAGPCVNIIPVRVRVEPGQPLDGQLTTVHHQHTQGLPFETSQFSDIAAHCTDWSLDSRSPELVVQFQNLDNLEHDKGMDIQGTSSTLAVYEQPSRSTESNFIFILAKPVQDVWEISVSANAKVHSQETVDAMLHALCLHIATV